MGSAFLAMQASGSASFAQRLFQYCITLGLAVEVPLIPLNKFLIFNAAEVAKQVIFPALINFPSPSVIFLKSAICLFNSFSWLFASSGVRLNNSGLFSIPIVNVKLVSLLIPEVFGTRITFATFLRLILFIVTL